MTVRYESWDRFKYEVISDLFPDTKIFERDVYLFRGLSNADWTLTTSFDRSFSHIDEHQRARLWDDLVSRFRRECVLRKHIADDWDDPDVIALGQHYGLPTRLLDWAASPYVASFFALREVPLMVEHPSVVAIWALDMRFPIWTKDRGVSVLNAASGKRSHIPGPAVVNGHTGFSIENDEVAILTPVSPSNPRRISQDGRFTLSYAPFPGLETYVRNHDEPGSPLLRMLLPAREALRALADLDAMGINNETLFPDLPGLAESVKLSVACEAFARYTRLDDFV